MDKFIKSDDIVLLLDNNSPDSQNLRASFQRAGYRCPAVVIEDDGFLPEDVMSAFGLFLGNFKGEKGVPGKPRYFNQIPVPDYWEISGSNTVGRIHDLNRERGRIFYAEPLHKRQVKIVDWYDDNKVVRSSDHYNRYGALYARTTFNGKGQRVNKSWFSADGREVVVENYVTGNIILNYKDQVEIFQGKAEFVLRALREAGFEKNRIFYNSLSTPFFVSQRLHAAYKRDVLFWQEPISGDIPGNMQIILGGEASRTARIMVQKKSAYEALIRLGASPDMVHPLGFIYPFEKENYHRKKALICTNSDQIDHCREIVEGLPDMHFHIAAITEMSSKLMSMEIYENVSLYPSVKMPVLAELFDECDYYLDINRESEIVSAVYQAFLHNHLIFAFKETLHNNSYVAEEHIYPSDGFSMMISDIRRVMTDEGELDLWLKRQQKAAMTETEEGYLRFWEKRRKPVKENPPVTMHITNSGRVSSGEPMIAQQRVAGLARKLGFEVMDIYKCSSQGSQEELRKQVKRDTAAIKDNDIVIFQSPSWNPGDYDKELLREIRRHRNIRLAIFIHDVLPMMYGGTEQEYKQAIENYNLADLVIVPTEAMLGFLQKRGLTVKKILIQPMWDLPFSGELQAPGFQRQIFFSGSPERFGFVEEWNYDIPLRLFADMDFVCNGQNICPEGWKSTTELLTEYTKGGFGLVWEQTDQRDYYRCNQPHKLSGYLAAGLPVIIQRGLPHENTVQDYEIGYVVGSLAEAADKVRQVSEEEYRRMSDNGKNIGRLIRGGFFTKKLLIDTVNYLMLG